MNLKSRKNALLFSGLFVAFLAGGAPNAFAADADGVQAVQQARKITGTVVDQNGEPIIGANVMVKGTTNGTITDFDGNFSLDARQGQELVVSYIGYVSQTVAASNGMTVTLKEDAQSLDEVVVVGYGVQKKKLVTGATVQVKGESISQRNTTSALSALQNQSPGVNIVAASGKPGDGFKVNIRGAGTNGDTTPIYVIDGVAGGDINSLNPADIESIDVLKDAASCAIYGARAANGVIMITTKQGKEGKVQVSYDGSIGWQNAYKLPHMLDAKRYMQIQDQINVNNGLDPFEWSRYLDADLLAAYQSGANPGTNWLDFLINDNAITTNHSVNIAGGSEKSKFSTGIGYQYQDGIIGGDIAQSDFNRLTFRMNSEHVLWKKGDLNVVTFGENLRYQHREQKGINIGNQYGNSIYSMFSANPLVPAYNKDGELFDYDDLQAQGTDPNGLLALNQYVGNPLNSLLNSSSKNNVSKSYNLNIVGYLEVQPIKNLKYRGQLSYSQYSSLWKGYNMAYTNSNVDQSTTDTLNESMSLGWNWGLTNTLNYKFNLGKHNIDALIGTEYSRQGNGMGESMNGQATGSVFTDFQHAFFNNFDGRNSAILGGSPATDHSMMSYFGRINYDFAETYMFSAILRRDGSSNFAPGHRWGWFPSVSAGWVVSNEKFMEKTQSWLDFLKLRASWGQNGNENIGAFGYAATFSFGAFGMYSFDNNKNGGTQGGYAARLSNPDLTWETSEQLNVGLDARFLNSKLTVALDYYVKKTKDLLISVPVSGINGFSSVTANAGSVKNSGIEAAFNWNDQIGKNFSYNVGVNFAHNKNIVTEVNNGTHYINGGENLLSQGTTYMARMQEGFPIGYFYGYKTGGVMQNAADVQAYLSQNCGGNAANSIQGVDIAPGDLKFLDTNGDGVVNESDKTEIGNPHPDFTMGLNLGFNYKGFDFAVSAYGAFGQQIAYTYRRFGDGQFGNYTEDAYAHWHGEGTSNRYPILAPGNQPNTIQVSDIYIENADYLRIQNVTLGYDVKNIWKKCPLQQLRVYVQAQNLYTFTGYKGMDPECGTSIGGNSWITGVDVGNYPQARTYVVGVNVKF